MDFFVTVGSTVFHHDFHTDALHPFWTDEFPAGSVRTGGFPHQAVLNLKDYPVIDEIFIVNPDGTQTLVATLPAKVSVHVTWQNPQGLPLAISGLTAPTLLPPALVPGGLEPVPQQPFVGQMFFNTASANFEATAYNTNGSVAHMFRIAGVKSAFAEVGTESLGVFAPP